MCGGANHHGSIRRTRPEPFPSVYLLESIREPTGERQDILYKVPRTESLYKVREPKLNYTIRSVSTNRGFFGLKVHKLVYPDFTCPEWLSMGKGTKWYFKTHGLASLLAAHHFGEMAEVKYEAERVIIRENQ
ncbi:hypothetical protein DFH06DRAFT_1135606 [Mycena polygramma]|nr:hypothetical protein DFH06DRAFT_1135606 [Mycena polygramma]